MNSSLLLNNLNQQQKQAVIHDKGPLLIIAGAGTGKTTVITKRIAYLIEKKKAKPEEILAVTFTDKAAGEMEERVDRLLPYGYIDLWISTFHSFCERVLRDHALDIGLSTDFKILDPTTTWMLISQGLKKFNLNYYRPLGNQTKFIHALINHFSRCKDQGVYPEDYLKYADSLKTNLTDLKESQETERLKEVATAYHVYQRLLLENNSLDFGDLINYCLKLFQKRQLILNKFRKKFKYILVDEFQDTNWAQHELVKLLALPNNNLTVCADDDQCLPGNTEIEIFKENKIKKLKIEDVKRGDMVLTAVGKGHVGISKVNKVFRRKKQSRLVSIKTKSGYNLVVTDNHKMFCCVPRTCKGAYHYVYLMYRQDMGWRIGVTNDLITRLRLERSADKILALKAFRADTEARYYETLWSLKYGIPTSAFKPREGSIMKGKLLEKLYKEIEVEKNVRKLARDLNVNLESFHHCLDAVNRGKKVRIIINLQICYRRYRSKYHVRKGKELIFNPLIRHRITLETSDRKTINKLRKAGYKMKRSKGGKKLAIEKKDLRFLDKEAKKLQSITGGFLEIKFNIASKYKKPTGNQRNFSAIVMPAKNLVQGHYLPVRKGKDIIYDEIIEIKESENELFVYDLEIDRTHNFVANGIVVHNSIYRWRGASYNNIIQFKESFPKTKEIFLIKNYRSVQSILDLSYNFIKANDPNRLEYVSKIDKKLKAVKAGEGIIKHLHFKDLYQEAQGVINKIAEIFKENKDACFSDFAILVRANNYANAFTRALERADFPYQFLASRGLYSKPIILDIISYFKLLDDYHEGHALYRILNLPFLNIPTQDIAKVNEYARRKTKSLYEALTDLQLISGLSSSIRQAMNLVLSLIKKHTEIAKNKNVSEVLVSFLKDSGYLKYLSNKESREQLDLINQFYQKIKNFEEANTDATLKNFMESLNMELESGEEGKLSFDPEQGPDMVRVMTIHAAKGLEFKYVFLVNLVDRRFPTSERRESIEIPKSLIKDIIPEGDIHLEEERRLCYVAITRAKEKLFLTSADNYGGVRKKKPSRFLMEMGFVKKGDELDVQTVSAVAVKKQKKKIIPPSLSLPSHLSFSQLAAFEKCPLQYKFAHVLKIPTRGTAVFSFGKTIHNTLYDFVKLTDRGKNTVQSDLFGIDNPKKEKRERKVFDFSDLVKLYKKNWIDDWYESKNQKQEYYKLGQKMIKGFYEKFTQEEPSVFKINEDLALEVPFKFKVSGNTLRGKIDRIDQAKDGVEIIDYKTGQYKEKLSLGNKKQLLIYQMAAEESLGLKPVKLSYYYLKEGKKTSFLGNEKDKEKQKQEILVIAEKIKNSSFDASPGWQCKFCDFKDICNYTQK